MRDIWSKVGFHQEVKSEYMEEDKVAEVEDKNLDQQENTIEQNFSGLSIRSLPKEVDEEELISALEEKGLPVGHASISINRNFKSTTVDVEDLEPGLCKILLNNIQKTEMFERNVFVKGLRILEETDETELDFLGPESEGNVVNNSKAEEGATNAAESGEVSKAEK